MSLDPPRCEHSRTLCSTVLSSREFKVNGLYTWEIYGELWGYLSKQYLLARVPDRLPNLVGLLLMCRLLLSNPKLDRNPTTKFVFSCNQNIAKSGIPTKEGFMIYDVRLQFLAFSVWTCLNHRSINWYPTTIPYPICSNINVAKVEKWSSNGLNGPSKCRLWCFVFTCSIIKHIITIIINNHYPSSTIY